MVINVTKGKMMILVMVCFTARVMVVLTSKNAQVSFQRQFVAEVMRCEETERRLRLENAKMKSNHIL